MMLLSHILPDKVLFCISCPHSWNGWNLFCLKTLKQKKHSKHSKQVDIGVVQVEFTHSNKTNILRIMAAAGYDNPFNLAEDLVFVKRGYRLWQTMTNHLIWLTWAWETALYICAIVIFHKVVDLLKPLWTPNPLICNLGFWWWGEVHWSDPSGQMSSKLNKLFWPRTFVIQYFL